MSQSHFSEVDQLVEMGFDRKAASDALEAARGDVASAIAQLCAGEGEKDDFVRPQRPNRNRGAGAGGSAASASAGGSARSAGRGGGGSRGGGQPQRREEGRKMEMVDDADEKEDDPQMELNGWVRSWELKGGYGFITGLVTNPFLRSPY